MLDLTNAPKQGQIYAIYSDKMVFERYHSLEEISDYLEAENFLEIHLFNQEMELRFLKLQRGEIKRYEVMDSEKYEDTYVESIYISGADIDKNENLEQKIEVINYLTYDENDMLHIVNYRLKEVE